MRLCRTESLLVGLLAAWTVGCSQQLAQVPVHELDLNDRGRPCRLHTAKPRVRPQAPTKRADVAKAGREWRYIVVHHSATDRGSAEVFDRLHRGPGFGFDELGYHFVITNGRGGPDGTVQVGSRWRKQKWGAHTGGTPNNEYNNHGVGICLVGDFTDRMPSRAQLESLRRLVVRLMADHDISPRNVIGHCDAPNACTQCPGNRLHPYLVGAFRQEISRRLVLARATGAGAQ